MEGKKEWNGKCKGKISFSVAKPQPIILDKREVFYDMKEHAIQPCEMAIKEITHLSKATINNLRSKVCYSIVKEVAITINLHRKYFIYILKERFS